MEEMYKFDIKKGEIHLFRKARFVDDDCGKLSKTFTGKLKTHNFFSMNYTLEDISGFFSEGEKYKVTKSDGEEGIMTKCYRSEYYKYEKCE
ncbi:hypothetical protein CLPU_4c00300 [Gottschalkia purinilytica]|uniref:Uncharacterized protein n=1 Tax=Gottschalkia purinilytica TaxID=1503 RepID=A0A0L0WBZ2_GOTPU|nr:hypothetical protein [Gottschalkia purinilytica]KNF08984.1 hypothetical protein CLPU_4c00300 [Gottschalkia purinilytica]